MKMISIFILILWTTSTGYANDVEKACFAVEGMTCSSCTLTVKAAVKKLEGIVDIKSSVEKKNTIVNFNPKLTSADKIKTKIDSVGYKATKEDCKKFE